MKFHVQFNAFVVKLRLSPTTMSNKIFTFGLNYKSCSSLFPALTELGINCVVDIRSKNEAKGSAILCAEALKSKLKELSVYYLPFNEYFGDIIFQHLTPKGLFSVKSFVRSAQFCDGIKRIVVGVSKGYTILILDESENTEKSIRYTAIGRELIEQDIDVYHIDFNTKLVSQQGIDARIGKRKYLKQQKNRESLLLGKMGEEIAGLYLIQHGFSILDRNWNLHHGCELDIVARKDNIIHFIEVKTRRYQEGKMIAPQIAINRVKMKHIRKAMLEYLYRNYMFNMQRQVDSVAIIYKSPDDYSIEFFEDIGIYN